MDEIDMLHHKQWWFAWRPVRINTGKLVWLQWVYCRTYDPMRYWSAPETVYFLSDV